MATYLTLTNELLRRINEVQIDEAEFSSVKNVQALAKDAINNSMRDMIQYAQEWPFTHVSSTVTVSAGVSIYDAPSDSSTLDWETFYLRKTDSTQAKRLKLISYEEYLSQYRPKEDNDGWVGAPEVVYMTQDTKFGFSPVPDSTYVVEYQYWSMGNSLESASDVAIVPERFKHVLLDGAMMYMMHFRSNEQSAAMHEQKFKKGLDNMRNLLVDREPRVTTGMRVR